VVVACAEAAVHDAVAAAGGTAVLTDPALPSGSDRVHAALLAVDPAGRHDAVVNLQGDLPTIDPVAVRAALAPLAEPAVDIATLAAVITDPGERDDPNVVKAVVGLDAAALRPGAIGRAFYFTRATAPSGDGPLLHHIGLYAYRRTALDRFVALPPSPLERRERLEQLRALEAGLRIDVAIVAGVPLGVDTADDLEQARKALAPGAERL
jgi:3-deoxy-manno-octulosonate cytidylyltransferase (CMP-KDO synthetase)